MPRLHACLLSLLIKINSQEGFTIHSHLRMAKLTRAQFFSSKSNELFKTLKFQTSARKGKELKRGDQNAEEVTPQNG